MEEKVSTINAPNRYIHQYRWRWRSCRRRRKLMYWQRRLPHWMPGDSIVFVTWRLEGTLPQLEQAIAESDAGKRFQLQDYELDRTTHGPRWLENPEIAAVFVEALHYGEEIRGAYDLYAWVVMPNHVHLVLKPKATLHQVVRWLKAATANRANRLLVRIGKPFWQREYFDHWIRNPKELVSLIEYVESNPVKGRFVRSAEDWLWSSASKTPAARPPASQ